MAIEFHCEHCNHLIRAPSEAAGKTGRCPHCHSPTYIPRPAEEEEGELDLAPLNESAEQRRQREIMEDHALQRKLLHEKSMPGEPGKGRPPPSAAPSNPADTSRNVSSLVVGYIEALSNGKLERSEELLKQLVGVRKQALSILDEMGQEDLSAFGLPALPRPVLLGFMKQLRSKL